MAAKSGSRRSHGFRDDRGVPLHIAPTSVLFGQLWGRTPARVWLRWAPLIAFGLYGLWRFIVDPFPPPANQIVAPFAIGAVSFLAVILYFFLRRRRAPVQSPLAAYLAAHRICGACGYDLHTVAPEADGCVVCPECGGAWHRDRFVMESEDPRQTKTLATLAARGHLFSQPGRNDDRGLPMRRAWGWPPPWLTDGTPDAAALQASTSASMRRFNAVALPLAGTAWAGTLAAILLIKDDLDTPQIVLTTVVTCVIAAIVFFAWSRIYRDRATLRLVRRMGLCPNCGHKLATDAPPTFDGCTVCEHCKLAWRLSGPDGRGTEALRAPWAGADASGAGGPPSPRGPAAADPSRPIG